MKKDIPNISFEFFPPKTLEGLKNLEHTAKALAEYAPQFFSVTYGAGGLTREGTLNTVSMLQNNTEIPVTPHLACLGSTKDNLLEILTHYKNIGINRLVALRGDLPAEMPYAGDFKYAFELVQFIREKTGFHFEIEVAAYPEFHPEAQSAIDDVLNLKRKFDAGANRAITQYFYNPDAYFYFLDKCAKYGIAKPIIPGIMPITGFEKLVRFSKTCGAEIPQWLYKRLAVYANDESATLALGLEVVHELCSRLIKGGAPGLHFYTLNREHASLAILDKLGVLPNSELQNYSPALKSFDVLPHFR